MNRFIIALTLVTSHSVVANFARASEFSEFIIKAPDGNALQLRAGANEASKVEGMAELLDGASVHNIGCKDVGGSRWCIVHYEATGDVGWVNANFLEKAQPFKVRAGSGQPILERKMPEVCQKEAGEAFGTNVAAVGGFGCQAESGGLVIEGTADSGRQGDGLFLFKCLFDNKNRFSDVMSMRSDGE